MIAVLRVRCTNSTWGSCLAGCQRRTLNTFLRFWRKRSRAAYVTIWLSREVPTKNCLLGCTATAGMECMLGSAMYLICTGAEGQQLWDRVHSMHYISCFHHVVVVCPRSDMPAASGHDSSTRAFESNTGQLGAHVLLLEAVPFCGFIGRMTE